MNRTQKSRQASQAPRLYAKLIALFPLRPIHDEIDYDNALEMAESLVGFTELTEDQADYLDVLADIIQKYEAQHHSIAHNADTLTVLKSMLEERDMTASDLGRMLGNRTLGAAILRGERQLSKANIRILADHFKVSTDCFMA